MNVTEFLNQGVSHKKELHLLLSPTKKE